MFLLLSFSSHQNLSDVMMQGKSAKKNEEEEHVKVYVPDESMDMNMEFSMSMDYRLLF